MKLKFKATLFLVAVHLALPLGVSSQAAEEKAKLEHVQLKFADATEVVGIMKKHLVGEAAEAVLSAESRTNRVLIDAKHPQAKVAREMITKLDVAKPAVKVAAVIKRVTPATATEAEKSEIIARPQIIGTFDTPMTMRISDGKGGTVEVELTLSQPEVK